MKISIVIPTYNQEKVLPECLAAIFNQTLERGEYEVLLINDGSADGTEEVVKSLQKKYSFKYFSWENKGPAAARNLGIKNARGEIIVLLGDDVIVLPNFLREHLKLQQKYLGENEAVVGFTTWSKDIKITPFMYWLEHGGPQFDYDRIKGKLEVDFLAFYTLNLSLKRSFLLKNGLFDESFHIPGATAYEDTELGLRLQKRGMQLFYNPSAVGFHKHPKTLRQVCKRRFIEGQIIHLFWKKHPEIENYFRDKLKYNLTKVLVNNLTIKFFEALALFCEKRVNIPPLFWLVCRYYYNKGMRLGYSCHSEPRRRISIEV